MNSVESLVPMENLDNTKSVARLDTVDRKPVGAFEPATLTEALGLARMLAKSELIPDALKDKPGDVLVVLMSGREYGVSPLRALQNFHVVKGRVGMSAQIIVGMCLRHAKCKYFQLVECDDRKATYETHREGDPKPTRLTYTIVQAERAGLLRNDIWKKHPENMLRARAATNLARSVYPDICSGVLAPDEVREVAEIGAAELMENGEGSVQEEPKKAPSSLDEVVQQAEAEQGGGADPITEEQANDLRVLLEGWKDKDIQILLAQHGSTSVASIEADKYASVVAEVQAKTQG